tara:strand:+ start:554 stop:829 length:276 start_codon:yes stop_codon:yes gene_type:complete
MRRRKADEEPIKAFQFCSQMSVFWLPAEESSWLISPEFRIGAVISPSNLNWAKAHRKTRNSSNDKDGDSKASELEVAAMLTEEECVWAEIW